MRHFLSLGMAQRDLTLRLAPILLILAGASCGEPAPAPLEPSEPLGRVEAAAVASNTWVHMADLPTERRSVILAAVSKMDGNTRLFAIGGDAVTYSANGYPKFVPVGTVTEWIPATNRWVRRANTPYVWQFPQPDAAVLGSKVYIPGGFTRCGDECHYPRNTMAVYDVPSNTWTTAPLPQYATRSDVWATGGQLYWEGECSDLSTGDGWGPFTVCQDSGSRPTFLLRYNPSTGSWVYLAPPTTDRAQGVTGVIGGQLYLAGGAVTNLDTYDPARNRWLGRQPLDRVRYSAGGDAVKGRLYVVGGNMLKPDSTWGTSRATSEYDPVTNVWRARAQIPELFLGRLFYTRVSGTRVVVDGQARLAILGGHGHHWQWAP